MMLGTMAAMKRPIGRKAVNALTKLLTLLSSLKSKNKTVFNQVKTMLSFKVVTANTCMN